MNDENSSRTIDVSSINPLIHTGPVGFQDTVTYARAVLAVLQDMKPDDAPSEDYNFGMSLIHEWISGTLEFAGKLPDVKYLVPAAKEAQS